MSNDCTGRIFDNIRKDCFYRPKGGIKNKIYLINTDEIDREATQLSENRLKATALVLKENAKVFIWEGKGKFPQGSTEIVKDDFGISYKHKVTHQFEYYGETERSQIQQIASGGRVTAIIEKADGGLNGELTFEILGFESGMTVQSGTWSSAENRGIVSVEFATEEGEEEATDRKIFLVNDSISETEAFIKANLKQ